MMRFFAKRCFMMAFRWKSVRQADDNSKQAEDVHYFMDEGVDLLIISANEAAPMTPIVEEAYQKGIPVILVDRKILSDKYTAYIGADNYEIGRAVGNYIASSLKGKGKYSRTDRIGRFDSCNGTASGIYGCHQ